MGNDRSGESEHPFLEVRGLIKRFVLGEKILQVLNGVDIAVTPGEVLMIVGRSGAGKSTLLHLMGLLDTPTAGQILLDGVDVGRLHSGQKAALRNREFGFVFQFYHLLSELTALENVTLPRMIGRGALSWFANKRTTRERAAALLERVGLADRMTHRPSQLSGGERQRVAIARALIGSPRLVFCDEPTGNLDEYNSAQVMEVLSQINESEGQTFVIVTHDREASRNHGDREIEVIDGKIVNEWRRGDGGEWMTVEPGRISSPEGAGRDAV